MERILCLGCMQVIDPETLLGCACLLDMSIGDPEYLAGCEALRGADAHVLRDANACGVDPGPDGLNPRNDTVES